jgi:hypothetical protein
MERKRQAAAFPNSCGIIAHNTAKEPVSLNLQNVRARADEKTDQVIVAGEDDG